MNENKNLDIRSEITVVTMLFGFLFVSISVLISMSEEAGFVDLIKKGALRWWWWGWWTPIVEATTRLLMLCSILLLASIVFYLITIQKPVFLIIARNLLAFGFYFWFQLYLLFCSFFIIKFLGVEGMGYINPLFGIVSFTGFILLFPIIFYLWRRKIKRAVTYLLKKMPRKRK